MKLLIVGSRSIDNFDFSGYVPEETDLIISGGAKGADTLAERYADEHKLSKWIFRPKYNLYGKAAPLKRNKEMVDLCDAVLVLWDGVSKGAMFTAEYARSAGKPTEVIKVEKKDC